MDSRRRVPAQMPKREEVREWVFVRVWRWRGLVGEVGRERGERGCNLCVVLDAFCDDWVYGEFVFVHFVGVGLELCCDGLRMRVYRTSMC